MDFTSHADNPADSDDDHRAANSNGGEEDAASRPSERKSRREDDSEDTITGHALGIGGAAGGNATASDELRTSRAPLPSRLARPALLSIAGLALAYFTAGAVWRGIGWLAAAVALPWWAWATGRFQAALRSGGKKMGRSATTWAVLLGGFILAAIILSGYQFAAALVRTAAN